MRKIVEELIRIDGVIGSLLVSKDGLVVASTLLEEDRAQAGVITYTKAEQEELGLLGSSLVM